MTTRTVKLSELVGQGLLEIGAGRPRSVNVDGSPLPILRVADVLDGKIEAKTPGPRRASYDQIAEPKVSRPGDIVLTVKGTVGRVAIMPAEGRHFAYSPQLCYFRPKIDGPLLPLFLYYWFKSEYFWTQANSLKSQTDMADFLSLGDVQSLEMRIPDRPTQDAIAAVLGALDDKIAVNERIIEICRSLAHEHYANALMSGAELLPVEYIAAFHNKKRVPLSGSERAVRNGPFPYYGAAGVLSYVDDYLFSGPHVLIGEDGTVVTPTGKPVIQYVWDNFWVNNHAHVLTGVGISTELLAIGLRFVSVESHITGAVQPKLSMGNLKKIEIPVPPENARLSLEPLVDALWSSVRKSTAESRTLATLRDALLPKLMSGQITVRQAESLVEDAT